MATLDVRKEVVKKITELQWCPNTNMNLKPYSVVHGSVPRVNVPGICSLDREDVESLIKALKKSIELGWV